LARGSRTRSIARAKLAGEVLPNVMRKVLVHARTPSFETPAFADGRSRAPQDEAEIAEA
jgi:hypothetical protein